MKRLVVGLSSSRTSVEGLEHVANFDSLEMHRGIDLDGVEGSVPVSV